MLEDSRKRMVVSFFLQVCLLIRLSVLVTSCSFSNGVLNLSNSSLSGSIDSTVFAGCVVNASEVLEVDMSSNQLTDIDSGTFVAFYNMQKINISHNTITHLDKNTFTSLTALQYLDASYNMVRKLEAGLLDLYHLVEVHLQHNNISEVEVGIVSEANQNLLLFDMSYNSLPVFEPWPYLTKLTSDRYIDRIFNLQHNKIANITNTMNWTHNLTWPFQVIVYLQDNEITEVSTGIVEQFTPTTDVYELFSIFFSLKINATSNPYICDCKLFDFVDVLHDSVYYWKDVELYRYRCASPDALKDIDWFHDLDTDQLVCNISETSGCPSGCYCQDRPHNDTFYINCDGAGLNAMPSTIPNHNRSKIEMLLDNNNITTLDQVSYLAHLYNLSVQNNRLSELNETITQGLVTIAHLDLRSNLISRLPRNIQRLNYGSVLLRGNPLQCDCESIWLADWVKLYADEADLDVTCTSDNGEHRLIELSSSELECVNKGWIILGIVIGFTVLIAVGFLTFFKCCPYESKVILYKLLRIHPGDKYIVDIDDTKVVDLYLVYDWEDVDARGWIRYFTKKLHRKKPLYSILNPCRFTEGGSESTNYLKWIGRCRRVIVLLSDNLFKNEWQRHMVDIAENYVTEAKAIENVDVENSAVSLDSIERAVTSAAQIIYVIYNKESDIIKRALNEEPWKSRLAGKTVLTCGQKMFWSKMRYELPKKGNGKGPDGNFIPPLENENGVGRTLNTNQIAREQGHRPHQDMNRNRNDHSMQDIVQENVNRYRKNEITPANGNKSYNNLANNLNLEGVKSGKSRLNVTKTPHNGSGAKVKSLENVLNLEPVQYTSGGKVGVHKANGVLFTDNDIQTENRLQQMTGRLSTFHCAEDDNTSLGDISMA